MKFVQSLTAKVLHCFEILNYFSALSYFSQAVAATELTLKGTVFMSMIDLNSPALCITGPSWHDIWFGNRAGPRLSWFLEASSREPVGLLSRVCWPSSFRYQSQGERAEELCLTGISGLEAAFTPWNTVFECEVFV